LRPAEVEMRAIEMCPLRPELADSCVKIRICRRRGKQSLSVAGIPASRPDGGARPEIYCTGNMKHFGAIT
jgi:hypothetical protein